MMKSKKINLIGMLLFASLFIVMISKNLIDHYSLKSSHKYTIGTVESVEIRSKGGFSVEFNYNISLKHYKATTGIYQFDKSLVGDRFYVKFSPSNPKNCELLLNERVPSYIKEAPPEGWMKIPE